MPQSCSRVSNGYFCNSYARQNFCLCTCYRFAFFCIRLLFGQSGGDIVSAIFSTQNFSLEYLTGPSTPGSPFYRCHSVCSFVIEGSYSMNFIENEIPVVMRGQSVRGFEVLNPNFGCPSNVLRNLQNFHSKLHL